MAKTPLSLPTPVVHLVIGNETLRQALALLLECAGIETQSHPSAEAFLEHHDPTLRGCLVLDGRLTYLRDSELQERLAATSGALSIILLTGRGRFPDGVEATRIGSVDTLQGPCPTEQIIALMQTALQFIDRLLRGRARQDAAFERLGLLTPREHQVLSALIHGKPNKTVAVELGISTRTVEIHRAHIRKKLGIRKISEAGRLLVLENGEEAEDGAGA
jgi:FixJ family two-component response regulator